MIHNRRGNEDVIESSDYDVIIAGAGPVGLFLACELALGDCSVLLLERTTGADSPLKQVPFGIRGLSTPTIEAFDRRGLLDRLKRHLELKNPHKTSAPTEGPLRQVGHFAGIPLLEGNIDRSAWINRLPSSTPPSLISDVSELETVLAERAEELGVEVLRGMEVTGFRQSEGGVRVFAADKSFNGKWLVGCDGARSVVRKTGDFEFAGTEPEFTGYSVLADLTDPEKLSAGRVLTAQGMYFQSRPGYLLIADFDGGAGHRAEPFGLKELEAVLQRVSNTNVSIQRLHAFTSWTDRARQATRYVQGRVVLAGDAAHIHSPLGGQGLNLGLGDAMNLGWKLAATIRGTAAKGLLDSYEQERIPIGGEILDWSRAQVAIMRPESSSRALNQIFQKLLKTRDGATYVAERIWGVKLRYGSFGDHRLAGSSVPNFEYENRLTVGELLRAGKPLFLDFEGDNRRKAIVREYGDQIRCVSGPAHDCLGVSAALVRPDGVVAWATDEKSDIEGLGEAIKRLFVPPDSMRI
ncbi:MAG: FAD-dependent oxidoreductase [Armatimonadetes bacterium 55-13]|nr:MAG: FAD-dependent oxidoreductase [Armatimonadetes bacterium 55-13]